MACVWQFMRRISIKRRRRNRIDRFAYRLVIFGSAKQFAPDPISLSLHNCTQSGNFAIQCIKPLFPSTLVQQPPPSFVDATPISPANIDFAANIQKIR